MNYLTYRHCISEGSPYEIGNALGKQLMQNENLIRDLTTPLFGGKPLSEKQVESTMQMFEKYIPGINEEIKGFSDAVDVSYKDMVIYSSYIAFQGSCSHFIVRRELNGKAAIWHGRNYDFGLDELPVMITARTEGRHRTTGFGFKMSGRFDGINDEGLCVTTSAADIKHIGRMGEGFALSMVVRALLEQCASVQEAEELFMIMPFAEYRNFLLSDPSGRRC